MLGLFGTIYSPYRTTVIKTTLIPKEACISWVSCPNSTLCSTYTINGWNNYTKVKVNDTAGNESSEATLYKSSSYRFNGTATNSNLITRSGDSNVVNITGQTATTGTISSTFIADNAGLFGSVFISGYPEKNTTID